MTSRDAHPANPERPEDFPGWEVDARDSVIRLTHVECDTTYPWDGPIPLDELHGTVAEHLRLMH